MVICPAGVAADGVSIKPSATSRTTLKRLPGGNGIRAMVEISTDRGFPVRRIRGVIYLLRHGDAEEGNGNDDARRLTAKGERQARAAGQALAALDAELDACLASPKLRAAETARLACEALGLEPETAAELRGGGFDATALAAGRGNVLLAGHEPAFSSEIARLTGAKAKMRKGGIAILDGSTLQALLRPRDLARIAETGSS
jgi:phosphohistidine phosphatase